MKAGQGASPEDVLWQHRWLADGFLATRLLQGPLNDHIELAQVVGKVMALQPLNHNFRHLWRPGPAEFAADLAHVVSDPVTQVLAPHPQRGHPDALDQPIELRHRTFRCEDHPGAYGCGATWPVAVDCQGHQQGPEFGPRCIEAIDQESALSQAAQ